MRPAKWASGTHVAQSHPVLGPSAARLCAFLQVVSCYDMANMHSWDWVLDE